MKFAKLIKEALEDNQPISNFTERDYKDETDLAKYLEPLNRDKYRYGSTSELTFEALKIAVWKVYAFKNGYETEELIKYDEEVEDVEGLLTFIAEKTHDLEFCGIPAAIEDTALFLIASSLLYLKIKVKNTDVMLEPEYDINMYNVFFSPIRQRPIRKSFP